MAKITTPPRLILPATQVVIDRLYSWMLNLVDVVNSNANPKTLANADAENNSIFYSSDNSKLVYKDSSGVIHELY